MTELEMTELMLELSSIGVTGILIRYDGSGDSGQIEEIQYCTDPVDDVHNVESEIEPLLNLENLNRDLAKKIEDFAYNKLLYDIEDWYNNDGGFGTISILIPSGQYHIDNNVRITDYESFGHEGNLIEISAK